MWGMETVDLLSNRHILPPEETHPPRPKLQAEAWNSINCSTDIFRSVLPPHTLHTDFSKSNIKTSVAEPKLFIFGSGSDFGHNFGSGSSYSYSHILALKTVLKH